MGATFLLVLLMLVLAMLAGGLVVTVLFYLNLHWALEECSPRIRTMEPGFVWLNFIPLFGLVWLFVTVLRVADSLAREYRWRRLPPDGDFGRKLGLGWLVFNLAGTSLGFAAYAWLYFGANDPQAASLAQSGLNLLFGIPALVMYIVYWVKIYRCRKRLEDDGPPDHRPPDDRFDDDGYDPSADSAADPDDRDRPYRERRRRADDDDHPDDR